MFPVVKEKLQSGHASFFSPATKPTLNSFMSTTFVTATEDNQRHNNSVFSMGNTMNKSRFSEYDEHAIVAEF